jgi:hypothetical protein
MRRLRSERNEHLSGRTAGRWHRRRHRWAFEQFEDRTLLATVPGGNLAVAAPLAAPGDSFSGVLGQGAPVFFQIHPVSDALLIAHVSAPGLRTRLSMLDSQGHPLVQSDGQSASASDDVIAQHVAAGTDYLEVQSLAGSGNYTLTTELTESSQPGAVISPSSERAAPLVAGDFNGDGFADLAVARVDDASENGYVEVLQGNGDGTFNDTPPIRLDDLQPSSLVIGDFNGDGRKDLAVAGVDPTSGRGEVEVLVGNGDGTFQTTTPIKLASSGPTLLATGDFNGDGRADLVVAGVDATYQHGKVEVLLGRGDGAFQAMTPIDLGTYAPASLVMGDFNGDGRSDLAVAGVSSFFQQGGLEVLLGIGDGMFLNTPLIKLGALQPASLVTGDYNGDRIADLAVAGFDSSIGQGELDVLNGVGDGTFQSSPAIHLGGLQPSSVVTDDFNSDGALDLIVGGVDSVLQQGSFDVLLGTGNRAFQAPMPVNLQIVAGTTVLGTTFVGVSSVTLVTGDFNGDGVSDFAMAGFHSDYRQDEVRVLLGQDDGTFQFPTADPFDPIGLDSVEPVSLATGDFNGDGRADLAVGSVDSLQQGSVEVLLGNGDGTFQAATPLGLGSLQPSVIAIGDFNGDGRADLAVAGVDSSSKQGEVEVLLGNGDGTFETTPAIDLGSLQPSSLVIGDFNGDGHADLAVAESGELPSGVDVQDYVDVLLGNGDGTFQVSTPIPLACFGISPALATGDFNGDGRADLVVGGRDMALPSLAPADGEIEVLLGRGDGTFQTTSPVDLVGYDPISLATGDFNGDRRTDLAVFAESTSALEGRVEVLLGGGDGTFQLKTSIDVGLTGSAGLTPAPLVTGDFNGDGRTDLAVAGDDASSQGQLVILLGNGDGTFQTPGPMYPDGFASTIVTGDFNGDGRTDIALASSGSTNLQNALQLLLGQGDGTFQTSTPFSVNGIPAGIVTGDFNSDGRADIAVAGGSEVEIMLGNGDGTFQDTTPIDLGGLSVQPSAVVVGDFNGDGRADIAVGGFDYSSQQAEIEVLLGRGDGTFRTATLIDLV